MKALVGGGRARLPPTIALNQLDEGASLPRNIYVLTLTIDGEARQLARAQRRWRGDRRGDRQRHASAAALRERVQRRMAIGRRRRAGDVPLRPVAGGVAADAARAREVAGRRGAPRSRRRGRGECQAVCRHRIPSYTSSEVNERQSPDALRDLDNVRFVDIPWLVDADAAAFTGLEAARLSQSHARTPLRAREWTRSGSRRNSRRDCPRGSSSTAPPAISRSTRRRQFVREGRLMQFRAGRDRARRRALGRWHARAASPAPAPRPCRRVPRRPRPRDRRAQLPLPSRRNRHHRADGEMLVFVEVRLRSRRDFGGAAESITPSSARGSPPRRRSISDVSRARRHAGRRGTARCARFRAHRVAARHHGRLNARSSHLGDLPA